MDYQVLVDKLNEMRDTKFKSVNPRDKYLAEFCDETLGISICMSKHYPVEPPDFYVFPSKEIRAHIDSKGKICLFDFDSLLIDISMPVEILVECYDRAVSVLNMDADVSYEEILREAESYWGHLSGLWRVSTNVDLKRVNYSEYDVSSYEMKNSERIQHFYFSNTYEETLNLEKKLNVDTDRQHYVNKCNIVRLKKNTKFIELKEKYSWFELQRYILKNANGNACRKFNKKLNHEEKSVIEILILILPTRFEEIAFGFLVCGHANKRVPLRNMLGLSCRPLHVRRLDYSYLVNRGGAVDMVENKAVLLLGCGSVGSFVAETLCKMGIKNLDILDNDSFNEENLYRHYLGVADLGNKYLSNKADLMKARLEEEFFDVDIDSMSYKDRSVESFIDNPSRLTSYDLIISALGEPTLNLRINELLVKEQIKTPFICAFNEPYGIGGHTILTNLDGNGCLQCLYTDIVSDALIPYRGSLVSEGQMFKKNISGCSSAFVPYSVLDSEQTAINTVRLSIKVLTGEEKQNQVITWIGESGSLEAEGFTTSPYYQKNKDKSINRFYIQKNCYCRVCKDTVADEGIK